MEKKVVLITGASNGIGYEMAKEFAKSGYMVAINYNKSKDMAEKLAKEIVSCGGICALFKADVKDYSQVEEMFNKLIKTFGHIDVLINNAGIASSKILIDETENNIIDIINANLTGTIYCSKFASEYMLKQTGGKIINISSIWGVYGASGETVYSASKGGIIAFTKALSKELAYSNIKANCIAPGVVDTNMMKSYTEEELESLKKEIPFGRFASPKEIARIALFLASDDANYITGQTIEASGGFC
ncbi:MAG: 3-oxoacyl-ACP reductase FabG [Clostridia bacterium]|nr:3-oxoacyl-ACP reductase FabG [Clostridia bacterium]